MTVHIYGVLDADGVKINTISLDDETLKTDWYPGYGAALIDEGEIPQEPPKEKPPTKPDTWGVLPFVLAEPMQNGDKIDFKTGDVVKAADIIAFDPIGIDPIDIGPMPVEIAKQ